MSVDRHDAPADVSRRLFLKVGAATGGGLLIGIRLAWGDPPVASSVFKPNAWIRIGTDGVVTLIVGSSEMGQGVHTSIPMLLAEELDCDWARVRVEMAPADKAYTNPMIRQQLTGGSTSIRAFFKPLRQAGAAARELLVRAAAKQWGANEAECRVRDGVVTHSTTGRRLGFGQLVVDAANLPPPGEVFLKDPSEFRLIGTSTPRKDTPAKVNGSAIFGMDVKLPGLKTAVVLRCPVFGGKLKSFDDKRALAIKGVRKVVEIRSGVAVVADSFWAAKRGRDALDVQWSDGPNSRFGSADIRRKLEQALLRKETTVRLEGNVGKAPAAKTVEAEYEAPYLAHACMEPMNCTARVTDTSCDIWVPTQNQTATHHVAGLMTGLPPERIQIHTTYLGGGFGRRGEQDFVGDAVELAIRTRWPIKVIWTREDDMQHDYYRPATLNRLSATLDADGNLTGWRHDLAGPSIFARVFPGALKNGIDRTSVEGAENIPYGIPNVLVHWTMENGFVPVGFWRSVGSSQNAWVTECFIDEVAAAAGKDPFEFRRRMLKLRPRHLGVLELAAQKSGWGSPLPAGRARGIAVVEAFGSFCAQVAEVSIENGKPRVHRVTCAIDCGTVINPDTVVAQMESGIVYGLSAALRGEITIQNGRVIQRNFPDYEPLRMNEMPAIDVHIVKSIEAPGGVGEPGTPPIAPAVANALLALTGKPVRQLPIRV